MRNINHIVPKSSDYLQILETIAKSPKRLYFTGTLPEQRLPTVAIVGSRKVTSYGKEVAYRLSYDLAAAGVVVVSGLALGIDGIAHQAALDAKGRTIAVLGNALPDIYPSTHTNLARSIVSSGGAILSEYEPGFPTLRHQFLERNRIVSGLCDVLLVVEAAARSGTLSTAAYALEQGKEVAAVPGNITSPMSAGCNNLIKQGAHPVTEALDVIRLLGMDERLPRQAELLFSGSDEEVLLLKLLRDGLRDGHELHAASKLTPEAYGQALTMLEINGRIRPLGANQWALA